MALHDEHNMNLKFLVASLFLCKNAPCPWSQNSVILPSQISIISPSTLEDCQAFHHGLCCGGYFHFAPNITPEKYKVQIIDKLIIIYNILNLCKLGFSNLLLKYNSHISLFLNISKNNNNFKCLLKYTRSDIPWVHED